MNDLASPKIDFLIITAIDEEYKAVIDVFGLKLQKNNTPHYSGVVNGCSVVCIKCVGDEKGNLPCSFSITKDAIESWKPRYVILLGIAGGIGGREDIEVGDIVVSDNVVYYEYRKVTKEKDEQRDYPLEQPSRELRRFAERVEGWFGILRAKGIGRPDGKDWKSSKVLHGLILSGEKIWDDPDDPRLQELFNDYKKALCVETEAAGVAKAIYELKRTEYTPQFIVIKAISDLITTFGGWEQREKWRKPAAYAAAAFAYMLIEMMAESKGTPEEYEFLKEYLAYLRGKLEKEKFVDGTDMIYYLNEYYVENKALLTDISTWNEPDNKVKGENWSWKDFLKDSKKWYAIIGAPFGVGKTTFVMKIALELVDKALDELNKKSVAVEGYIPIVVRLRDASDFKLMDVYNQQNIDNILKNIAGGGRRKILLILDGLDEYRSDIIELWRYVREYHGRYPIKVIITTRLLPEIPDLLSIKEYIRLFSFTEPQVDYFFKKYRVDLDFNKCRELGLGREEITKPLFSLMIALMFREGRYRIKFNPEWGSETKKALLYYMLTHSILKGKHRLEMSKFDYYYQIEKELLRILAALKNLYDRDLTLGKIVEEIKTIKPENIPLVDLNGEGIQKYLKPILTSYYFLSGTSGDPIGEKMMKVDFIHESFKEYFLAEYYYEKIKNRKMHMLNVGIPSEETMNFLNH
ncbi:hypothetical protein DRO69_04740 [Candidatus Bathyarchaeota archaeon]|nr:MAG: hypothetical protein DRO69_04740 [Candidatus Bathyarchaeota archaeon]